MITTKVATPKRKVNRRVIGLVTGMLLFGVAAGGFYVWRQHQISRRFLAAKSDGLAALHAGDDPTAVRDLSIYLQRYPNDTEALAGYANARILVPYQSGQEIGDTIAALRSLLKLEPNRIAERRTLLGLYSKAGYLTEALQTADLIVSQSGEDAEVVGQRSRILVRLRRFDQALASTQRWAQLAPNDFEAPMTRLWVMQQLHQPPSEITAVGEETLKSHPGDPEFELVCGYAYALVNDRDHSVIHTKTAAAGTPTDEHFATMLLDRLDALGLYDDSMSLLQRLVDAGKLPTARHSLARRYWEVGRAADAEKLLEDVSPEDSGSSEDLLALRAMALAQLKTDNSEIPAIRQALANRHDSAAALAWSLILDETIDHKSLEHAELLDACQKALQRNPADGYLEYFVGASYAEVGEYESAIAAWQKTLELNRSWSLPAVRLADACSQAGRDESAMAAAREAFQRAPGNVTSVTTLARVWFLCIEHGKYQQPEKLLGLVKQVQKEIPNEEQTLVIEAALLARDPKTRDEAKNLVHEAATGKAPISQPILLRLAALSKSVNLGLEDECFQRALKEGGTTPDLALGEAINLLGAGETKEGLALFERCQATADPDKKSLIWRSNHLRLLDLIQSPAAAEEASLLGDAYPDNVEVQRLVLNTFAARSNRDFMDRTIQRFRKLTGERGVAWRVARGRWLLQFTTGTAETDEACNVLIEATKLAPDLVEARVLLASAFERADKPNEAIAQLTVAADLSPTSSSIGLQLVRLFQSRGDFERAREQLERITATPLADASQRRAAAALLAQQGESQRAIDLLEESNRQANPDSSDLMLARLYQIRNQPEKAEAITKKLLEKPDATIIQFTADLLATHGQPGDADRVLGMLDHIQLQPGVKELTLADYCARHKTMDEALTHFHAAVADLPKNPSAWKAMITCQLASGNVADALSSVEDGRKHLPDDRALNALHSQSALIREGTNDPRDSSVRSLAADIIKNPDDEIAAADTMRAIIEGRHANQLPDQLNIRLEVLGHTYPSFMPLQLMLATNYLQVGRLDDAVTAATRASQISPTADEPYRLLYLSFAGSKRWGEALNAAREWSERSLSSPIQPALAIADAQLALNQPADALEVLQPFMGETESVAYRQVLPTYARAQKLAGSTGSAALLEPLLNEGPSGRRAWILFAVQNLSTSEATVWLDRVQSLIPKDSVNEQIALAGAWAQLYSRSPDPALSDRVISILAPVASGPTPTPEAIVSLAMFNELLGNDSAAEPLYRRAIGLQPDSVVAMNNLAMLLLRHGNQLSEAHELVAAALKSHPNMPALYDTLAEIETKENARADAIENMKMAIRLSPRSASYRIRLAQDLAANGQLAEAKSALKEMDDQQVDTSSLPTPTKDALEALRKSLSNTEKGTLNLQASQASGQS